MTSVLIAAHNEETVIVRCLDSLLADASADEFEVIVVANGCTDATADRARLRGGATVLEIPVASKPAALNAGDLVAKTFPRIYLDADINLSTQSARALRDLLLDGQAEPGAPSPPERPLAAVPLRVLDLSGRPLPVRAYYAINSRLPLFRTGLFGRGAIAISEAGRGRFVDFPDLVADDLFLDSVFTDGEKRQVDSVATVVATPFLTRDLVRRLIRVRRGNAAMRAAARNGEVAVVVRQAARFSWLRDVVLPQPWLAPAAVVYVAITAFAAFRAKQAPDPQSAWGRDDSTRGQPSS